MSSLFTWPGSVTDTNQPVFMPQGTVFKGVFLQSGGVQTAHAKVWQSWQQATVNNPYQCRENCQNFFFLILISFQLNFHVTDPVKMRHMDSLRTCSPQKTM